MEEVHGLTGKDYPRLEVLTSVVAPRAGARSAGCRWHPRVWLAGPKGVHGRSSAHILIYIEMTSCCEPSPLQSAALTASPKGTPSARAPRPSPRREKGDREAVEEVHGRAGKNNSRQQVLTSVVAPRTGAKRGMPEHPGERSPRNRCHYRLDGISMRIS